MIPDLGATGHLPAGRFRASLGEIEERFVLDSQWVDSTTRVEIWNGFRSYVDAWLQIEADTNTRLLKAVWLGGSFISGALNPSDVDASPIYDDVAFRSLKGRPGSGRAARLIGHRQRVVEAFNVEPFPIRWRSIPSTLFAATLDEADRATLAVRGGMDDWWQRVRPSGPKRGPEPPENLGVRGYIEVVDL